LGRLASPVSYELALERLEVDDMHTRSKEGGLSGGIEED
jgi:hypothetical protein